MQSFREIKIWQRMHGVTLELYRLTASFPASEAYGLFSQIRRASVSVEANIAEGSKKISRGDYLRYLNNAEGSLTELDCLVTISRDLSFIPALPASKLLDELDQLSRMLNAFRTAVQKTERASRARSRRSTLADDASGSHD